MYSKLELLFNSLLLGILTFIPSSKTYTKLIFVVFALFVTPPAALIASEILLPLFKITTPGIFTSPVTYM